MKSASQLHNYVATIASLYRDNPFHNFEHASHVTMSVVKLLSRIVAPSHIHIEMLLSLTIMKRSVRSFMTPTASRQIR
jgi:hypothetical protein